MEPTLPKSSCIQAGFEINEGIVRPEAFLEFFPGDNLTKAGRQRFQRQHRLFLEADFSSSAIGLRSSEFGAGQNAAFVTVADLNRDGKLDLAVAECGSNVVTILLGNGDGMLKLAASYPVGMCPVSVAGGDFNRDEKLDLSVTNIDSNSVSVLRENGDGTFQPAVNYPVPAGPVFVALGGFNGDRPNRSPRGSLPRRQHL